MPRLPRKYIKTPFYHIMSQGIRKEDIFNTDARKKKYLSIIQEIQYDFAVSIITYCVMDNHAHLLVHADSIDEISNFMHKLNGTYGTYYNKQNNRVGYVFRNRFRMEGVNSERYVFNCIQYIHNNPIKAGICEEEDEYFYSGCKEFDNKAIIIDSQIVHQILGDITYKEKSKNTFLEKINFIDLDMDNNKTCKEIINRFFEIKNLTLPEVLNNDIILTKLVFELKIKNNLSNSCIARNLLTNRKRIAKLCPQNKKI